MAQTAAPWSSPRVVEGWTAVVITLPDGVDNHRLDLLSGELFTAGSAGLEIRDRQEPAEVVASFEPGLSIDVVHANVSLALESVGIAPRRIEVEDVPPIDWETHWRRDFEAMSFGPLWVVPTWLEPPAEAQYVLRLDPGMAFGTGRHETTALCLERLVARAPIDSVLDVGTGTGILAMAALLLGTPRAVGTDNDPDALVVARENAERNGLSDRLDLSGDAPDALGQQFSFVVANILRDPLIALAPEIGAALRPGGAVLLSGILDTQVDDVVRAYHAAGFTGRQIAIRGEWAAVELSRPR